MQIPDSRFGLAKFFLEQGYKVGAEIGVYKGEFLEKLCADGLLVYGIDPWLVYSDYLKHPQEDDYEELYQRSKALEEKYNCKIIRKTSEDALNDFGDNSLDFVFIDANHSLPYIAYDIYHWYKKVRPGGAISGHDYFQDHRHPYHIRACHVKQAVDAFVDIFKVKDLYILKNDKYPSWLWIKE